MNPRLNNAFVVFRSSIMLGTFILAIMLENAKGERLAYMIGIFSLFFLWLNVREIYREVLLRFLPYTFIVDALTLVLLETGSKFVVNYYFNIYYFFVLIAAGFLLKSKKRLIVSFLIIVVAFIKYYRYFEASTVYNLSFVASYIIFTLMVFLTVSVFFNYSRLLSEEKSRLNSLNEELQKANSLLAHQKERIKELTIFKERTRIAREIHDSVGHNLTGLIMNLDFCEKLSIVEPQMIGGKIGTCREIAQSCLEEIRRSVKDLRPPAIEQLPLVKAIEELISESRHKFMLDIHLEIIGELFNTAPEINIVIFRAVQETITNSAKHGKASELKITLTFSQANLSVFMKNNGQSCPRFNMGSGLIGMQERVKELGGEVSFYSRDGFMIDISIPVEVVVLE